MKYAALTKDFALYDYLIKKYETVKERLYFLFDEIQEVENWQKIINSLRVDFDCDIYLTGSNASLLSGELASYLTGRTIKLEMQPLSFQEFLAFKEIAPDRLNFDSSPLTEYIRYGGFPAVVLSNKTELKANMLYEISENIIFRDVAIRGGLTDMKVLQAIIKFLLDNIGQPVSANRISNTLQSANIKTSTKTVLKILDLLENAYVFKACERFDIRGKGRLSTSPKYYVADTGLRNQLLGSFAGNRGGQLENIVYNTLIHRGYEVYTGRTGNKEIDFVAIKDGQTSYLQVTYQIPENTHETDNLLEIRDGFKKVVITQNWDDVGLIDGIPIIHVIDFLLSAEVI